MIEQATNTFVKGTQDFSYEIFNWKSYEKLYEFLWKGPLVCTSKKNGELRLCLDSEHLNKALKREHYMYLPVLREMLSDIAHAKVFSTFDLENGYWHLRLDEESSYLTTFDTPFGRYEWLRLPFGTSVSPEMFKRPKGHSQHRRWRSQLWHWFVEGRGHKGLWQKAFLMRCQAVGIQLNPEKMRLKLSQVQFMGHLVTDKDVLPDPDKVTAIRNLPAQIDLYGVHRLCGTENLLSDFIPSLASIMEPMNMLKRKQVEFKWDEPQRNTY